MELNMQIQSSGTEHRGDMVIVNVSVCSRHETGQSSKPSHILLPTVVPFTHFLTSNNTNTSFPAH